MKRWLPLLLTLALALGCAGCARRQTVTVYRIVKEGAALLQTETITVPDDTDPVQVMIDALGAAPGEVGDFGISHRFMNELATHLKPGSSALFIPLKKEAVDETLRALGNSDGVVLSTDLKLEDEYQMEKLFEEMTAERAKKTS